MDHFPDDITVQLIKDRDSDSYSWANAIEIEDIIDWYSHCQQYIWQWEIKSSNQDKDISFEKIVHSVLATSKTLKFTIQYSHLEDRDFIFMTYTTKSKLMHIDFGFPVSKAKISLSIETAKYFKALLGMGSDGILDENYLKLFPAEP